MLSTAQDVKYCFSDDTLPDGYAVNEGDMVHYQPFPMGRMEFLWGADAEEFRPERWLDGDGGVFVPESSFKFTAFQVKPFIQNARDLFHCQLRPSSDFSVLTNHKHVTCLTCDLLRLRRRGLASVWERSSRTGR